MIPPRAQSNNKKLPPEGTHIARVVEIIYLGSAVSPYANPDGTKKTLNEIRVKWELPTETAVFKEGEPAKPFVVNKKMTLSMFKKSTLRPFVEGIIGTTLKDEEADGFDVDNIIGKTCLLSISIAESENGKYIAVNSASPLVKGMVAPPQVNPSKILSFDKWDEELFTKQPEFIKIRIEQSKEYRNMRHPQKVVDTTPVAYPTDEINPDDIPF